MTPRNVVGANLWLWILLAVAMTLPGLGVRLFMSQGCGSHARGSADEGVVAVHHQDVRYCQDEARGLGDAYQGTVEMFVRVRADGSAQDVVVRAAGPVSSTSEMPVHVLQGCLEAAAYTWRWPATGTVRDVMVPLESR
jgi:hypothetical protein